MSSCFLLVGWLVHFLFFRYKFYSSSVLFVWDAASSSANNVHVKLVDFAHTYPNKPGDNSLDFNSLGKKKKNFVFVLFVLFCLVCFLWFVCLCAFTEAIELLLEQWRAVRGLGEEIWENQRGVKGVFASKNLTPAERGPYSTRDGKTVSFRFDRVFQHF